MWTRRTTSDDHRPPREQWPRWYAADEKGVLTVRVSSLISPERAAAVLWRYGRWLMHLARFGGICLYSQWREGYGGGENAAARAWSDSVAWKAIKEHALDGEPRGGARLGWLTRAGWDLVTRYGVPTDRHAPSLAGCRTTQALCWLEYAHQTSDPTDWEGAPSAFPSDWRAEHAVPDTVAESLVGAGARLGLHPIDLTQSGRIAFSIGPLGAAGRRALFAVDGARERGQQTTLQWLRDLHAVRSVWPDPWKEIALVILAPGDRRARWWVDQSRLWAANGWALNDMVVVDTGLEERHGVVLVY